MSTRYEDEPVNASQPDITSNPSYHETDPMLPFTFSHDAQNAPRYVTPSDGGFFSPTMSTSASSTSAHPSPLMSDSAQGQAVARYAAVKALHARSASSGFISSPLNPSSPPLISPFARSRHASHGSLQFNRVASEDSRALATPPKRPSSSGAYGDMILYRLADPADTKNGLLPPALSSTQRNSIASNSGDSIVSLSYDSKYPTWFMSPERGLVPYAYDPSADLDEADFIHDNDNELPSHTSIRGLANVGALLSLIVVLLCLFILYPVVLAFHDNSEHFAVGGNIVINSTGQAVEVDPDAGIGGTDRRRSQILPLPARRAFVEPLG